MNPLHLNVLTHLHTYASNGPASSLDQLVTQLLKGIFGTIPEGLIWRECFTDPDTLRQILAGKKTRKKIDILFLTDHLCSLHYKLDRGLLKLATEDRRIGLGCEIQTVCFSKKQERFVVSPEVLLYGDGRDRYFEGKPYTGIDDVVLAQLYEECTVPGSVELEISRVNSFCREHGIACALAHPFDCQQLDLQETLDVISTYAFIEGVNGGFPRRSSDALQEYINFHNQVIEKGLAGALLNSDLTDHQRYRINKIAASDVIVSLGGSDAHYNDFDRVVTCFRTVPGKTLAADFVHAMLESPKCKLVQEKRIEPVGSGAAMAGLYKDVAGIVYLNIRTSWHHFCHPRIWPRLIWPLIPDGLRALKVRVVRNKSISEDYQVQLNIADLRKKMSAMERETLQVQPDQL